MGTHRLSILLATPPGFNPGMAATELALHAFLRRHGLASHARCYRLIRFADRLTSLPPAEQAAAERRADTGVAFSPAFEDAAAIAASDARLFWADYLHMAVYLRELTPIVAAQRPGRDAAEELLQLLLLDGADDETLARTVSFGTTLLFNTLHDEREASYARPLRRFLRQARRVWVRDALSAARVAHLRGDYETAHFGVDCALLLGRDDVARNAEEQGLPGPRHPGSVLAFFGRERRTREPLIVAAIDVGRTLNRPVRWLQWGDAGAFPHLDARPDVFPDTGAETIHELLLEVAHASAVVTDTYHLAVLAWALGVPAVGAFAGNRTDAHDVSSGPALQSRDKREVFYSQYDALDFLIRPEELMNAPLLWRRTAHIREAIRDEALCAAITARMRAHAMAVEAALARELFALLPAPVCA